MMSSQEIQSKRRRGNPLRWLIFLGAGLLILVYLGLELWPRFVGGLLDREGPLGGGWSEQDWNEAQIVWDPSVENEGPPEEEESFSSPSPEEEPGEAVLLETRSEANEVLPTAGGAVSAGGGKLPPTEATGPGAEGSVRSPGEGRRSPQIFYKAWVRQDLLEDLDVSGKFHFRLRVETDGRVSDWELLDGFDCEVCLGEAERIIRALRFIPGTLHGEPVACWVPYAIDFQGGKSR